MSFIYNSDFKSRLMPQFPNEAKQPNNFWFQDDRLDQDQLAIIHFIITWHDLHEKSAVDPSQLGMKSTIRIVLSNNDYGKHRNSIAQT
jgi:hypothetical protein